MNRLSLLLLAFWGLLFSPSTTPLLADQIPYNTPGTVALQTLTYATGNGIQAYFVGGSAGYEDQVSVYDVQTGWNSGKVFDNKTTSVGTGLVLGASAGQIHAGDQLVFFIDSPDGRFASVAADSSDGVNHAYVANYEGGTMDGYQIPKGVFVGLEDLQSSHADWNYNDLDLYLTGVSTTPVGATPEPASLVLLGTGVLAMAGVRRLRRADIKPAARTQPMATL